MEAPIHAQMLVDQGSLQEAVSALRTIVRDNPKAEDALQLLAEVLLNQGHLDLAVDTLGQLAEVAPANIPVKVRLAQLLAARGETENALGLLALVTKLKPEYMIGWESTARVVLGGKQWQLAEQAIAKLEAVPEQQRTAAFLKGQKALAQDDRSTAIAQFHAVIDEDPAAPIAEHALSALFDLHTKAQNINDFVTYASGLTKQTAASSTLLGDAYLRLKQETMRLRRLMLPLLPMQTKPSAYLGRAKLYVMEQKTEQALSLLKQAQEKMPSDARVPLMIGDILSTAQRYDEAISVYEGILRRTQNNDVAANNLAQFMPIINQAMRSLFGESAHFV